MPASFSQRTCWNLSEEPLAAAVRQRRHEGRTVVDLTVSNPTACGFLYDDQATLAPLADKRAMHYDPQPLGSVAAREAVTSYYASHGAKVHASELLLTTSTSEAYSFLFRLLCDPGDEVLVAQPSYPLFDFVAALDSVVLQPFPLFFDFGWWIDFAVLEERVTERTRALLLVHPNNPTGHATSRAEREQLRAFCSRRGLALIVDEVFLDYGIEAPVESFASGPHPGLTFVVSGLSKVAALPQVKVGWMAVLGPPDERRHALGRLEVIADTFLSLNAPAQCALPQWLAQRSQITQQILDRIRTNLGVFADFSELVCLPVEAGWSAVVRLPQWVQGEDLAVRLLNQTGVLVHPGNFYALPGGNLVVLSLLVQPARFRTGVELLNRWCESRELVSVTRA